MFQMLVFINIFINRVSNLLKYVFTPKVLSDSEKRKLYDRGGEEALKQQGGFSSDPFDSFSRF